jgi:hypothetical protein
MFQVAFLFTIVASHVAKPTHLGDAYGFPVRENLSDKPIEQIIMETIKGIYAVNSWPEFFDKVMFDRGRQWGREKFSRVLRDCVKKSEVAGYHFRCKSGKYLQDQRRRKEREWLDRKGSRVAVGSRHVGHVKKN